MSVGGDKADPDFWMDRLNHLRAKANLGPHRSTEMGGHHMLDNKVADENLNLNQLSQKVSLIRKEVSFHKNKKQQNNY